MLLPSSADLVRAFVHDLGNVLETQVAEATRPLMFYALTGVTLSWIADADYRCVAVIVSGTGNSWFFGLDTKNPASIGTSTVYLDTKICGGPIATNETPVITGISVPVPAKSTLSLVNGTAGSMALTCFLQLT
jgi:hypothetical protein